jgi:hypothetical protein
MTHPRSSAEGVDVERQHLEEIRRARRDLDEITREIQKVPGYRHFLSPPTFDDVAEAAQDHPIVYIAASTFGGLALVVRNGEVAHVPLPALTADVVHARVEAHRAAYLTFQADRMSGGRAWSSALDDTTRWLWEEVMGAVLEEALPAPQISLISGGLLGLLPLHAAWTEDPKGTEGRRYVLDAVTISYLPNARSLTAARRLASIPARRLLAVPDPSPRPLKFTQTETTLVAKVFDQTVLLDGSEAGLEATAGRVLAALTEADVAHFACHGRADLAHPLDSSLSLTDGQRLRLRDLLDLPTQLRLRLAVLSACETSVAGTELPDEVISLPSGLLQAGVGGVVASLWDVPDRPTATLMAAFYWFWRHEDLAPSVALRCAQRWARRTTNEEKVSFLEVSVDSGMYAEEAIDLLCGQLLREPDPRSDADVAAWGAFGYVGA